MEEGDVFVAGANEIDAHFKNVCAGRDFAIGEQTDLAEVREGDVCAQCQQGSLRIGRGIELGHTFKLGTKYTAPDTMDVTYLDPAGEQQRVIMGCYGIGVERLMASVVERWHDEAGMIFPAHHRSLSDRRGGHRQEPRSARCGRKALRRT